MSLIYASTSFYNGQGKIIYTDMVGEFTYNFWEEIRDDINNPDYAPILDMSTGERYEKYVRTCVCHAVIKMREGTIDNLPFISSPEKRMKLGSYSFSRDVEAIFNEDESYSLEPYLYPPGYFVYSRQSLPPVLSVVPSGSPELLSWAVDFSPSGFAGIGYLTFDPRFDQLIPSALPLANSIIVNLPDGIIADMAIYYTFTSYTPFNPDDLDLIVYRF